MRCGCWKPSAHDNVPVALGPESPLDPPHQASHVHGFDGLADLGLPLPKGASHRRIGARSVGAALGKERPGELDLIAVGPLTNLAAALEIDPDSLNAFAPLPGSGAFRSNPPKSWSTTTTTPTPSPVQRRHHGLCRPILR